jgi:hypothetical protein
MQVAPNFGPGVRGIGAWRAMSELFASLKRADWETRSGRAPRLARPLPAAPLSAPHLAKSGAWRAHPLPPHHSPYASPYRAPPHPPLSLSRTSRKPAQGARHEPLRFHFFKVDIAHPPSRYAHSASRAIPAAPTTSPPTRLQRSAQFRAAATFAPVVRADHAPGHDAGNARENRCVSSSGVDNTSKCN